jgi:hypothetical protein
MRKANPRNMLLLSHVNFLPAFQNTEEVCSKGLTYTESKVQGKVMLPFHVFYAQSKEKNCDHSRFLRYMYSTAMKQEFLVPWNIWFTPVVTSALQLMCCVWNIFEVASSLDSDIDHYVIRQFLYSIFNICWEPKLLYCSSDWTLGTFS